MSRPSIIRFFHHWFLLLAIAICGIACGGRSDEGLMTPLDGGNQDGALLGDAARDGDASDDVSLDGSTGFPDGTIVLPDGVIVLPDGARVDGGGTTGPDGSTLPDGGMARRLVRISVDPAVASIGLSTPQQLSVTGFYSDGSTPQDLTAQVQYSTTAPGVATVNTTGLVTGVSAGEATINVVKQPENLMTEARITVTTATVTSLAITPATATVGIGATVKFTATATLSDGRTQDVTATVNWTSSDAAVASIAGPMTMTPGLASGIAAGMTTIRATMPTGGVTATATLTVTAAKLVSIAITPPNPVLPVGVTFTFAAAGTYDDGVVRDVTNSVQWASSTAAVANVGATGSGTTLAAGTTNITATLMQGGAPIVGTTTLTVTAARLVSIEVTPAMSTVIVGGPTQQLVATGRFDNNTTVVLTASVAWTSSLATSASVSNAAGSEGRVTGLAPGMAMITATLNNITGTATVNVVAARLVSIAITPAMPSVPKGATTQLTATGTYDIGTMADVTTLVTWSTAAAATATISNAAGTQGQVTGVAVGMTQVTATAPGAPPVTATATLNVTDAVPASLEISPANGSVQVTRTQQMTATAIYTDGQRVNVTTQVNWTTGRAATATVSNGAGSQGVVTAVAAGTTTVTATWAAWSLMGTTNITVTPAIPTSITVSPATAMIATNATQAYTAVVLYDIGTQATVTGQCMWTSSDTAVATMGTGNAAATATGRGGGMVTITCTYTAAGVTLTGTATLTVAPITVPVSLNITPDPVSVTTGGTVSLIAIVTYDNGMTATVTNTCAWVVYADAAAIASVTSTGNMRGIVTGVAPGVATIQASFNSGGVTLYGTAVVTVEGTPTGLTLSPGVASPLVGQTQNYTVTVLYSDGNSRAIPANNAQTVCTSSDTGIATFQVMGMNRTATCLTEGMVTLTCTYTPTAPPGVTGTAQLDCQSQVPIRIDIAPGNTTVALGTQVQYTATATYADNTMANITTNALTTWNSSAPGVASINNSGAQKGQANTLSQGTTTISVNFRGVMASVTLTVGPIAPVGLSITPTGGNLPIGSMTQYTALLLMSDSTSTNVTQMATWTSSTPGGDAGPAVATVSNSGTRGIVTAVNSGNATIRASYTPAGGTNFTDSINVTVP